MGTLLAMVNLMISPTTRSAEGTLIAWQLRKTRALAGRRFVITVHCTGSRPVLESGEVGGCLD